MLVMPLIQSYVSCVCMYVCVRITHPRLRQRTLVFTQGETNEDKCLYRFICTKAQSREYAYVHAHVARKRPMMDWEIMFRPKQKQTRPFHSQVSDRDKGVRPNSIVYQNFRTARDCSRLEGEKGADFKSKNLLKEKRFCLQRTFLCRVLRRISAQRYIL